MAYSHKTESEDEPRGIWALSPFLFTMAVGLIMLALISVFFLGNLFAFVGTSREEVRVPDVTGMDFAKADTELKKAGLKLNIYLKEYSNDIERDLILKQEPAAGSKVKKGRTIHSVVSLGKRDIKTPNLLGMDIETAKEELKKLSLTPGETITRYSDNSPVGTVINQAPKPNTLVAKGEAIRLIVSKGAETLSVEMPDLDGYRLDEALRAIDNLGLRVSRITRVYSAQAIEETITSQAPQAGRLVKRGSEVILTLTLPTIENTLGERSFRVAIEVPESDFGIEVNIIKNDRNETKEIYRETIKGPAQIEKMVTAYGSTTISIYFDGKLVREETF